MKTSRNIRLARHYAAHTTGMARIAAFWSVLAASWKWRLSKGHAPTLADLAAYFWDRPM